MENYIVIGYDPSRRAYGLTSALFQVGYRDSNTKQVQDEVAEDQALRYPHIIYTVVLEKDYRKIFQDIVDGWFGR